MNREKADLSCEQAAGSERVGLRTLYEKLMFQKERHSIICQDIECLLKTHRVFDELNVTDLTSNIRSLITEYLKKLSPSDI